MKPCIVSAYYKIPSKQPHAFYFQHLLRFFQGSKNKQIIFFTTPDVIEEFAKYVDLSHIRFICLKFSDFEAIQKFGRYFWGRQKQRDSAYFHTPELGIIWFEKKEFVLRAAEIVPDADVYIWCDAGCVRNDESYRAYLDFTTRNTIILDNHIHLQQIRPIVKQPFYTHDFVCLANAIIYGNKQAWREFSQLYDETLMEYDEAKVAGIMDQYVTLSCVNKKPELFQLHTERSTCDEWFKFLELL
jgi:hypothetical protein